LSKRMVNKGGKKTKGVAFTIRYKKRTKGGGGGGGGLLFGAGGQDYRGLGAYCMGET